MHKHHMTGEPAQAPTAVQKAKNLIEDFFGLTVVDAWYVPAGDYKNVRGGDKVYYTCDLLSPTGKQLFAFNLTVRPADGWVSLDGKFVWAEALQVAIDNFINNPNGGGLVLGDWKPDPAKLEVERADPPQAPFSLD
jgi:hypothetical protein